MTRADPNVAMGELAPIIRKAAAGDLEAQRTGRALAFQDMTDATRRYDYAMGQGHAMEAMFWARLAASHGHEEDAISLAAILMKLAEFWGYDRPDDYADWGNCLLAEAVTILDDLASNGNEAAAASINEMAERLSPRIFQRAKEIA